MPTTLRTARILEVPSHNWPATLALMAAAALLAGSFWLPYAEVKLVTPDRPQGSQVETRLHDLRGPLHSALAGVDRLCHARLSELTKMEDSMTLGLVIVLCLLVVEVAFARSRWAALLVLPAFAFSLVTIADTAGGLTSLVSSLSDAPEPVRTSWTFPFVQHLEVTGIALEIRPGIGLILALGASMAVFVGLWLRLKGHLPAAETERTEAKFRCLQRRKASRRPVALERPSPSVVSQR